MGISDLKVEIEKNKELKEKLYSAKSAEEAVKIANNLGYDITLADIENDGEISDYMLEAVAGGKGDTTKNVKNYIVDSSASGYEITVDRKSGSFVDARKK